MQMHINGTFWRNSDVSGFADQEMNHLKLRLPDLRDRCKLDADFRYRSSVQQVLWLRLTVILCLARQEPFLKVCSSIGMPSPPPLSIDLLSRLG